MWSIGCIVAELVLLDQLVPTGSNDVDQQTRVYNRLGRPGPEFIRLIRDQAVRTPCQHDRVYDLTWCLQVLRYYETLHNVPELDWEREFAAGPSHVAGESRSVERDWVLMDNVLWQISSVAACTTATPSALRPAML